jgi:hypothetical protein
MSNSSFPHQLKLFPVREHNRQTRAARLEICADQNRGCAEIILRAPERFGGASSLMVGWARAVLSGRKLEPAPWRFVA